MNKIGRCMVSLEYLYPDPERCFSKAEQGQVKAIHLGVHDIMHEGPQFDFYENLDRVWFRGESEIHKLGSVLGLDPSRISYTCAECEIGMEEGRLVCIRKETGEDGQYYVLQNKMGKPIMVHPNYPKPLTWDEIEHLVKEDLI